MSAFENHPIDLDELKTMSDDDIYFLYRKYKELINKEYKNDRVQKYEIECCYIQREIQARERIRKHNSDPRA